MDHDDRHLSDLLQRTVPTSRATIEFDQIAARVRRRRATTAWWTGAGTVGVIVLAVGIGTGLHGADRGRDTSVATTGPTGSSAPSVPPDAGCPPTEPYRDGKMVMVDYVPFIQFGGQQFVGRLDGVPALSRAALGKQVATVTCRIADLTESGKERVVGGFRDGNAAYLTAGTPIYAVNGYATNCRVAVIEKGEVIAYLAQHEVDHHSVPTACATDPAASSTLTPGDGRKVTVPTHCGVLSAIVDGQLWLASPPLGDHNPPSGWDENEVTGTFTKTGKGTATFHGQNGEVASFRLGEAGETDPNAGCE